MTTSVKPVLAITLGDVCGVGPEVVVRALSEDTTWEYQPLVVGDRITLQRAAALVGSSLEFTDCDGPIATAAGVMPVWNPATVSLQDMPAGCNTAQAGKAAYQWLNAAIDLAFGGSVAGIVTAPISKAALHMAGHYYPGHTEILAERAGVEKFSMMLHLPACDAVQGKHGLSVAHVTLHNSISKVPTLMTQGRIEETIELLFHFVRQLGCDSPRIGVCALNPHAGEGGLFGDEEQSRIAPAIESAAGRGALSHGPIPADTLFLRAVNGEFDGVVAMYHDQGHIALKLIAFRRAVNVTLGLPFVRTSPSHGTAFDIAWQGKAEADGMRLAIQTALKLARNGNS